jgi:hypothetical protein
MIVEQATKDTLPIYPCKVEFKSGGVILWGVLDIFLKWLITTWKVAADEIVAPFTNQ